VRASQVIGADYAYDGYLFTALRQITNQRIQKPPCEGIFLSVDLRSGKKVVQY